MSESSAVQQPACPTVESWPAWQHFAAEFLSADGRIIDPSDARTVSEGQAYALFFSLLANDQTSFEKILQWTENNLAGGDLSARLPAWHWGQNSEGDWGVLDDNAASDADLWIAYSLVEAGRIWNIERYEALGNLLAQRIYREETADIPGLGRSLLPAPRGFVHEDNYRLNPSYWVLPQFRRLAELIPTQDWAAIEKNSVKALLSSTQNHQADNWVYYQAQKGFSHSTEQQDLYDAIRVYLWIGLLSNEESHRAKLIDAHRGMITWLAEQGVPPLTRPGDPALAGPSSFSLALLPFLAAAGETELRDQQYQRAIARPPPDNNYYAQALRLFSLAWQEGRLNFDLQGQVWRRCPS